MVGVLGSVGQLGRGKELLHVPLGSRPRDSQPSVRLYSLFVTTIQYVIVPVEPESHDSNTLLNWLAQTFQFISPHRPSHLSSIDPCN